jgi:hypothetical protein
MVLDVLAEYRRMRGRRTMSKPTFEQLSELHEQVKADRITRENLQAFLRNPNLVFGPILSIDRSRHFNPAKFIGEGWSIIGQDESSLALTEVDISKIRLETMLKDCETQVQGEEKLRRLKATGHIQLDAKIFQTFWENKDRIPESWKSMFIYFDGTILQSPDGCRCVLYLCWSGDEWDWYYYWLESGWDAGRPSAVLAK